jgi:hypothetical protein
MLNAGWTIRKNSMPPLSSPPTSSGVLSYCAGTGALLATDRRIEKQPPDGLFQRYQNSSNIALGGVAASVAGLWVYGIKTTNPYLKETGNLELETLTNTFLIYAPMQFIAGRQRPGQGNGNGDFLRHHGMNTSFPAVTRCSHGHGYSSRSRVP